MIKLYVLHDIVQDKLIAIMDTAKDKPLTIGAVIPETDGNYYKSIVTAGSSHNLAWWWQWVCDTIHCDMSDEFYFEQENIKIKELTIE